MKTHWSVGAVKGASLLFWTLVAGPLVSGAVESRGGSRATVKSESVAVSAQMSKTSPAIESLKKGREVRVGLEIRGSRGAWCAIRDLGSTRRMGYVLCKHLEIERPQETISPHTFTVPEPTIPELRELAAFQTLSLLSRLRPELSSHRKWLAANWMTRTGVQNCVYRTLEFARRLRLARGRQQRPAGPSLEQLKLEFAPIEESCRASAVAFWAKFYPRLTPDQKMIVEQEKEKNPALRAILP